MSVKYVCLFKYVLNLALQQPLAGGSKENLLCYGPTFCISLIRNNAVNLDKCKLFRMSSSIKGVFFKKEMFHIECENYLSCGMSAMTCVTQAAATGRNFIWVQVWSFGTFGTFTVHWTLEYSLIAMLYLFCIV